jgi:hypothetical protein
MVSTEEGGLKKGHKLIPLRRMCLSCDILSLSVHICSFSDVVHVD